MQWIRIKILHRILLVCSPGKRVLTVFAKRVRPNMHYITNETRTSAIFATISITRLTWKGFEYL